MRGVAVGRVVLPAIVVALATATPALAYGGPGSVVSGIGALLATAAAIVAAIFGFLWYPLKRLWRRLRGPRDGAGGGPPTGDASPD